MRHVDIDLPDIELEEELGAPEPLELGLASKLVHGVSESEEDDELGLRSLYENPEILLGSSGRSWMRTRESLAFG